MKPETTPTSRASANRPLLSVALTALLTLVLTLFAQATARFIPQPTSSASYVLDDTGVLWAWGDNTDGQLGDGTQVARARPRPVAASGVSRWTEVSASRQVLAIDQAGRLWAWGSANGLQSLAPVQLTALTNRWQKVAALETEPAGVSLDTAGEAWMWQVPAEFTSGTYKDLLPIPIARPQGVNRWTGVAAGHAHAVLLADSGRVFVLGANRLGHRDDPLPRKATLEEQLLEEQPSPRERQQWLEVAAGPEQCFGRLSDGEWYFWGAYLDATDWRQVTKPQLLRRPATVSGWRKVVAGEKHVLLLSHEGLTFGLGWNVEGELAAPYDAGEPQAGYTNEPVKVITVYPAGQHIRDLGGGWQHGLSLGEDRLLYSWGGNDQGQLGRAVPDRDWRPGNLQGQSPPFSPTAPGLPLLQLVALRTNVVAPVLVGQSEETALYEVRRVGGPATDIVVRSEVLPDEPIFNWRIHTPVGRLWPQSSNVLIEISGFVPGIPIPADLNQSFSGPAQVRAKAPPWVEWIGDTAPIQLTLPPVWSVPPQGVLTALTSAHRVGQTSLLQLSVLDPDDWVTGWDLSVWCPSELNCISEPISVREGLKLLPGTTNTFTIPWTPTRDGSQIVRLILKDSAGSVVTEYTTFQVLKSEGQQSRRFTATWQDTPPALVLPARVSVRVRDLTGGSPVVSRTLQFIRGGVGPGLDIVDGAEPAEHGDVLSAMPPRGGDVLGRVVIKTRDGESHTLALPTLYEGRPDRMCIYLEAVVPETREGSTIPAVVRVVGVGGDPNSPKTVSFRWLTTPTADVPPPYINGSATATPGDDYNLRPVAAVSFPFGQTNATITILPRNDSRPEGTEGVTLELVEASYFQRAGGPVTVRILDDDLDRDPLTVAVDPLPRRHSANGALELNITTGGVPAGSSRLELFLDDHLVATDTTRLEPPLPVGDWNFRVRLSDQLGREAWSQSWPVQIHAELDLLEHTDLGDGTDLWRLQATPEFQPLTLQISPGLNVWQSVQPWFITPTNRVLEVRFPAGNQRYLRVVPAP